ncbi:MAG TPA: bifunctional YncE family protein/alkaline phosphatase family protein [Candidatus Angelobacter sp.]|jgi:YVTN family beta-propeller protein|nr:bifunctional YncE family protein/alkaline phosphatase family protein [Candidatus Angelobacter sp.]
MAKSIHQMILALTILVIAAFSFALPENTKSQNAKPKKQAVEILPTGMSITPTAAKGSTFQPLNPNLPELPHYTADHPISTTVSPDGNTLLVLTSGFNRNFDAEGKSIPEQSKEYVFVYDIRQQPPVKKQVLKIPNTFAGITWKPDGAQFYVSGGSNDNIHVFTQANGQWSESPEPISLGHEKALGVKTHPMVAGLAVNASGTRLVAANYENDSVSVVDLKALQKVAEIDLRPGKNDPSQKGVAGGAFPFWPVFKGDDKVYVSSVRDREIVVLDLASPTPIAGRIKVQGQPNKLILNKNQSQLFVACDNSDSVAVIDTGANRVTASIGTTAPEQLFPNKNRFRGSNPNSLVLSPDEHTLYVTNGGTNSVAVIKLSADGSGSRTEGLIPTGWYPQSVSLNHDGSILYIVNGKSNSGPNPKGCRNSFSTTERGACASTQQYILQLIKGGFQAVPRPGDAELHRLTQQVASNNRFATQPIAADPLFSFLHDNVKHVIYIVKENRTYDQLLGDLKKGNGDPSITLFKEPITPNHHDLARNFVTLDNFYDSGDVSGNGWNWSTAARATDVVEKDVPMNYSGRGFTYDFEGVNRGINVSVGSPEERAALDPRAANLEDAADQLPGTADVGAPDGPEDSVGAGYLWDAALNAGLKVRNYGFFLDLDRYSAPEKSPAAVPLLHDPAASTTRVAFPSNPRLHEVTDPYFRGFDQKFADYWRFKEWEREFDDYVKDGNLPSLELVRFCHDHFGDFKTAVDGVNTVETEMADNDYAVGLLVEKVAKSKYAKDTLIFVIEDDAQNGPDHVDAHRSIAFVVGPYIKQGAVVSRRFNTVSMLRTIEDILGTRHLGLNDAVQEPMSAIFSRTQTQWSYTARVPAVLRTTQLPLPPDSSSGSGSMAVSTPRHDAEYWQRQTEGFDFSAEDKLDSAKFNQVLWKGLMGDDKPYPTRRSKQNLRLNRDRLLKQQ